MKTIFKTMFFAGAIVLAAGCGNTGKKDASQTQAVVEEVAPSVAVEQVFEREVPQMATYTSTVQAYVKNNIAPQSVNRIKKINVEVGDFVKKGQVLAEMDLIQLQQAELQMQNKEIEYKRLKALYDAGGLYEGVENLNDEERCLDMSAQYLQGFKYSRPLPIFELADFVKNNTVFS